MGARKSIYKNDEGRRVMAGWYDTFVDRLGRESIEFLEVDTRFGRTNILVTGPEDAPPLWCFHGAMASAPAALSQIPALTSRYRIHFPDTIGQPGRSDTSRLDWQGEEHGWWVVDVLDGLGIDSIAAMGVSLGGYVIVRTASVAPERINKAVLWVPGGLVKPSMAGMLGLIGAGLVYAIAPSRPRLEKILSRTATEIDDQFVDFFGDSLKHVNPDRRFPNTLPDGALSDWRAPVMLIAHGLDTVFPADALVARAKAMIPNIEHTEIIPDWKHMPPFDNEAVEPLLERIYSFLD